MTYKNHKPISIKLLVVAGVISGLILVFLAVGNFYLMEAEIRAGENGAAQINISGRQRMLLKSTALYSLQLVSSTEREYEKMLRDKLQKDINLMDSDHAWLIKGEEGKLSKEIESLYFGPPYFIDRQQRTYIAEVKSLLASNKNELSVNNQSLLNIIKAAQSELPTALDAVVWQYQAESESNNSNIHNLQKFVLAVTLVILLAMALLIFVPLVKRIYTETQKLIESEERLESAQRVASLGNWEYDLAENSLWWSDEIYSIFGLDPDKTTLSYETFINMVHPDDRENLKKKAEGSLPQRSDYRVIKADSNIRHIHEEVRVERDRDGRIKRMWGTAQDVTEQKEIEAQLKKFKENLEEMVKDRTAKLSSLATKLYNEALKRLNAEEKFKSIFNNANDAIFIADAENGIILEANKRTEELLHIPVEEIVGLHFADVHPEEESESHEEFFREAVSKERSVSGELFLLSSEGKRVPVEVSANVFTLEGKRVIQGIFRDITDRKQLEDEMRKLSSAVKQSPASIIITDIEGNIEYVNPKFTKTTGYTYEEAIGRNPRILKSGEHPPEFYSKLWNEISSGNEWSGEFHNKKKSGELFWESASIVPIVNEKGVIINFLAVNEDITELKKMKEELVKKQKLESVGILAGGIAHDFNNILTAIVNNVFFAKELVLEGEDVANVVELLESANDACFRAKGLTKQLLTFSKGGAPVLKTVLIGELIKKIAEFGLRGSTVKASYDIPDDLWPVDIDEGQISQVINNLIINAGQAMPGGGIIEVKAENLAITHSDDLLLKKGKYIMLAIKDDGQGIPKEIIDKIFDPYFSTKEKGSGLGLSTSYSIINNHKGLLHADSEEERGATFYIYLPASRNSVEASEKRNVSSDNRGGRILVLEDDVAIVKTLRDILNKEGFEAEYSADGNETIELYKKAMKSGKRYDAVMLDLIIPGGMGGKESMEKLKRIDPDIKAIVCSGYSENSVIANYEKYGFSDFISKPYEIYEIREKLSRLING
ncbi:MAG: PAS domain S-box protein [bacterium]|nr:PAS domain S-box protein [bacterium]